MHNQLTIANFNSACHYLGKQEDAFLVNNAIRRMVRERFPAQLSVCVDSQLSALASQHRVYRIRKLQFNLCITRADMELGHLTEQLVATLMQSLEQQLSQASVGVKVYADMEDFHGALIADLLAGRAWSQWEYDEFRHWQLLDDSEAIVQLLLPKLSALPRLLQRLQQRSNTDRLLKSLDKRQLSTLFQHWAGASVSDSFSASIIGDTLRSTQFAQLSALQYSRINPDGRGFVRQLLCGLFQYALNNPAQDLSKCLREMATVQFIRSHGRKVLMLADRNVESIGAVDFQQHGIETDLHGMAKQLLFWLLDEPSGKNAVAALLFKLPESLDESIDLERRVAVENNVVKDANTAPQQFFYSDCAGLALLIPVAISLGLYQQCSATVLREAIALCLADGNAYEKTQLAVVADWLMKAIPGNDDEASEDFELPSTWRCGLSESRQGKILESRGAEQCRRLLLAQFASRLTGMSASSDAYLQNNFLRCPGSIKISESAIVVTLEPIALRIVLDLAGYSNWSDRLPWSERRLIIEMRT